METEAKHKGEYMKELNNPFVISGYCGRRYFCDREAEVAKIIEALGNNRNVSLISPRRMGKTGLIHRVFEELTVTEPDVRCFYVDIFSTQNLKEFVLLLSKTIIGSLDTYSEAVVRRIGTFFRSLRPVFSFDELTGQPSMSFSLQANEAEAGLKEIFDYMEASGKRCYIAIDEFQQITDYPEKGTEALLRSHIQFSPNVHFVFAGSKKHIMDAMFTSVNRPFYQSTQKVGLKEIPCRTYCEFARGLFSDAGMELPEEVFEYIYDKMFGHTWYVQYMMNLLFAKHLEEYTSEVADSVINDVLNEEEATYKTYCEMITKGQLRLLQALAKEKTVAKPLDGNFLKKYNLTAPSSVRQALTALRDKGLVLKDDRERYCIYDRFFSLWLERR